MIIVTGAVTARPETFEALLEECLDHVRRSRREPGCLTHAVHVDCENPLRLVFLETWTDRAALRAHFKQAGSAQFMQAAAALGSDSTGVRTYDVAPSSETGSAASTTER